MAALCPPYVHSPWNSWYGLSLCHTCPSPAIIVLIIAGGHLQQGISHVLKFRSPDSHTSTFHSRDSVIAPPTSGHRHVSSAHEFCSGRWYDGTCHPSFSADAARTKYYRTQLSIAQSSDPPAYDIMKLAIYSTHSIRIAVKNFRQNYFLQFVSCN